MTQLTLEPELDEQVDTVPYEAASPEEYAHIINPPANTHIWKEGMDIREVVTIARTNGLTVTALCGKTWVPVRDPEQHDLCPTCFEIASTMQ